MTPENKIIVKSVTSLDAVALQILNNYPGNRVFAFHGSMGAGKTTLIKSICNQLGAGAAVCSPTFTIINEYASTRGFNVYHFDFYRLKNAREAFDTGAADYLSGGSYCFIEWPEIAPEILPEDTIHISILPGNGENERIIYIGASMTVSAD